MRSTPTIPDVPPAPSPSPPRGGVVRLLAVAAESKASPLHTVRQWAGEVGVQCEYAPDLPRAARRLSAERWDAVVTELGDRADEELAWWMDAVRGANGGPRLIALVHRPSMGLVLRAER